MEQGYLAQVQALIDQKWKENPEEMKRVMAELEAKKQAKQETPKRVVSKVISNDPTLTAEVLEELNKGRGLNIERIKDLIIRGANPEVKDRWGICPFHWACYLGDITLAQLCIDGGVDINVLDRDDETALHWACDGNSLKLAEFLLDLGLNSNAKTRSGKTPLDYSHTEEMRNLIKKYMK
jgi:ankyrin repeat protein